MNFKSMNADEKSLDAIRIKVNGGERDIPAGTSVSALLLILGIEGRRIAVELNREIVPKSEHVKRVLAEGDQLEIVTMVGGG